MIQKFVEKLHHPFIDNGAINIVALGDSVTQGCFGCDEFNPEASYSAKLKKLLNLFYPNRVFNLINSGIEGTNAAFAWERFERDVLKYNPDLVLIMFGVNDFGDIPLYESSLKNMFTELNKRGIPAIYITEHMMNTYFADDTPKAYGDYPKQTAEKQNDGTMDKIFEVGRAVAKEYNIPVCDMYAKWKQLYSQKVDVTKLLANRVNHPIPEMHSILAYEILSVLLF